MAALADALDHGRDRVATLGRERVVDLEPLLVDLGAARVAGNDRLGERGAELAETEAWRKAQQDMIDKDRELLKSAQTKLQASKNSKDFGAASREVENRRKSISDREAELKKVVEASASSTAQMLTRDKDVEGVRTELTNSPTVGNVHNATKNSSARWAASLQIGRAHV